MLRKHWFEHGFWRVLLEGVGDFELAQGDRFLFEALEEVCGQDGGQSLAMVGTPRNTQKSKYQKDRGPNMGLGVSMFHSKLPLQNACGTCISIWINLKNKLRLTCRKPFPETAFSTSQLACLIACFGYQIFTHGWNLVKFLHGDQDAVQQDHPVMN
eukprot:4150737-Amphidinium_carterae.1